MNTLQIGLISRSKYGSARCSQAPAARSAGRAGRRRSPCLRGDDTGQPEVTGWEPHLLSLHWAPLPPGPGAALATRPSFRKWLSSHITLPAVYYPGSPEEESHSGCVCVEEVCSEGLLPWLWRRPSLRVCRLQTQEEPLFPVESGGRERPYLSWKTVRWGELLSLGEGQPHCSIQAFGAVGQLPGTGEGSLLCSVCWFIILTEARPSHADT